MVTLEELTCPGELNLSQLKTDYGDLLIDGEAIEIGFNGCENYTDMILSPKRLVSVDRWVFTNKRLLVIRESVPDAEPEIPAGFKLDLLSIPYRSILRYHLTMRAPETNCQWCGEPYPWVGQTGLTYSQVAEEGLDFKCTACDYDYAEISDWVPGASLSISVQRPPYMGLTATIQRVDIYKLQNILARNLLG